MAGSQYTEDEPIAEINIVPMVDVILVILIIFMVTAPMVLKPTIDVSLPQASSGQQQKQKVKNIEVTIDKSGTIYFENEPVTLEQLKERVTAKSRESVDSSVVLTADKNLTLDALTSIIDVIKKSGIKKVGFSIQKK